MICTQSIISPSGLFIRYIFSSHTDRFQFKIIKVVNGSHGDAYPKEEKKRGERAKKKRKRRWEYIKGQSLATKLVVS